MRVVGNFLEKSFSLPKNTLNERILNVNIPDLSYDEIKGFSFASLSKRSYIKYRALNILPEGESEASDLSLIKKGYTTISSLAVNFFDDYLSQDLIKSFQ